VVATTWTKRLLSEYGSSRSRLVRYRPGRQLVQLSVTAGTMWLYIPDRPCLAPACVPALRLYRVISRSIGPAFSKAGFP
jgi:hypothetical protein